MSSISILSRSYDYAVDNALKNGWVETMAHGGLYLTEKGIDEVLIKTNDLIKESEIVEKVKVKDRAIAISRYIDWFMAKHPNAVTAFIHLKYFSMGTTKDIIEVIQTNAKKD